jgi:hypothetical protein
MGIEVQECFASDGHRRRFVKFEQYNPAWDVFSLTQRPCLLTLATHYARACKVVHHLMRLPFLAEFLETWIGA